MATVTGKNNKQLRSMFMGKKSTGTKAGSKIKNQKPMPNDNDVDDMPPMNKMTPKPGMKSVKGKTNATRKAVGGMM